MLFFNSLMSYNPSPTLISHVRLGGFLLKASIWSAKITTICPVRHTTLENWHFTWKWWFPKNISSSKVPFAGSKFWEKYTVSSNTKSSTLACMYSLPPTNLCRIRPSISTKAWRWWPVESSWSQWGCIGETLRSFRIKKPNSSLIFRNTNSMPPYELEIHLSNQSRWLQVSS